ncbi:uncharacterized protein LOC113324626 [Papaver somniferum]|uniref:uncharacterized protein LOC113324626 n=1 Tax=Papaver somniferum TaxID=3469 RepID=UPI000E6F8F02|nr:uncharacterized protein LOC113324626 [Papaver somniferum]
MAFRVLSESKHFYYFEYKDNNDDTPIDSIKRINFTPLFGYRVFGSFNGLVCFRTGFRYDSVYICNPVTREYVKLPKFNRDSDHSIPWTRGFGYLPLTNEYQVVEIHRLSADLNIVEVLVYTVGGGSGWKIVGRFDIQDGKAHVEKHGVFVNGALHWVESTCGRVFVFDLTEEKFREHVSRPPRPPDSLWPEYGSIGVVGGVLYYFVKYFSQITRMHSYDIWPLKGKNDTGDMKEQVVQEPLGWREKFTFYVGKPLSFTKSSGVLYFNSRDLGIYDASASTSKELVRFSAVSQIFPHKNTLVSLK